MSKQKMALLSASTIGLLVLIFGGRIAIDGARCGIEMCLQTLIPSLFPYFFLCGILTSLLIGQPIPVLCTVGRICHMTAGSESLLAVGLLGGYPTGAAMVRQAHQEGHWGIEEASRLAAFCNNAGPAFIFGMIGQQFPDLRWTFGLWFIQIFSSIVTGFLLPGGGGESLSPTKQSVSLTATFNRTLRNMASVCGWVILFRMILEYLDRLVIRLLKSELQVLIIGLLELSNGCLRLQLVEDPNIRFCLGSVMLSAGGICVLLQTCAVFPQLHMRTYMKGRLIHLLTTLFVSTGAVLFCSGRILYSLLPAAVVITALVTGVLSLGKTKKPVAIPE